MNKIPTVFGILLILGALIITGCGTATPEPTTGLANPASVSGVTSQPTPTVKLPAEEESTKAPQPVPTQAVTEMPGAAYAGINFTLDPAIAAAVVAETVPATEEGPGGTMDPAHVRFSFNGYVLPDTFYEPRVLFYPVAEFEAVSEYAGKTIADLRQLLKDRPAAPEAIPFLPPFNAQQMMRAQVAYVDFQNGMGVRFLTHYAQAYQPVNNHELFYTFQGLTDDGKTYVAAVLPVSHPTLPADPAAYEGDLDTLVQDYDGYIAEVEQQLDAQAASSFTPDLSLLDGMIRSLAVASPAGGAEDAFAGWESYANAGYGFAFRYPPTWTLDEEPHMVNLRQGTLLLAIAFQRQGEDVPPPWTGMPAGDFESRGMMAFLGQGIEKNALVYEGKVKVVTYSAQVGDMLFSIRLDDTATADYQAIEISEAVGSEVDHIVGSFETLPPEEAGPELAIEGIVLDVSLSARLITLQEPVDGFSVIALTEESELVSVDGDGIALRDIRPGMRIQASGQPGASNALLASTVRLLEALPPSPSG